jgi:hypothetical protein
MNTKNISVVLLNYKGAVDTIACLSSLQKVNYSSLNIIIVDNASPDNSLQQIENYILTEGLSYRYFQSSKDTANPRVRKFITIIQSGTNNGYGHGNNIGIKYALDSDADYVLVLNNDTIVDTNFLKPMVEMCEGDSSIGIASCKINFYDNPERIWYHGGEITPFFSKVVHFNFNEKDDGQVKKKDITFISGCLWLIPRKVLLDVGYINEDYFMYVEDVEYCHRVLKKGYTLKVCESSQIYHKAASSSGGHESEFSVYWSAKNYIRFINENRLFPMNIPAFVNVIFIQSLRWLWFRKPHLLYVHLKGVFNGFIKR